MTRIDSVWMIETKDGRPLTNPDTDDPIFCFNEADAKRAASVFNGWSKYGPSVPVKFQRVEEPDETNCSLCGHLLLNNKHDLDQNDAYVVDDKLIHSGRCTYCNICNPQTKRADHED